MDDQNHRGWAYVKQALATPEGREAVSKLVRAALPWILRAIPQSRAIAAVVFAALPFVEAVLRVTGYELVKIENPSTKFASNAEFKAAFVEPNAVIDREALDAIDEAQNRYSQDEIPLIQEFEPKDV